MLPLLAPPPLLPARRCRSQRRRSHSAAPPPHTPQMGLLLWMNMTPSLALVMEWLDESTLGECWGALPCPAPQGPGIAL